MAAAAPAQLISRRPATPRVCYTPGNPYTSASQSKGGLTDLSFATPASTALIGKITAFDLGLEYQNPISAPVTLSDGMVSMNLDSQKIVTTFAQIVPGITKALSWQHQIADLPVNL